MFLNKEMWKEKCSSLHATDRFLPLFCMHTKLLTKLHKILFTFLIMNLGQAAKSV